MTVCWVFLLIIWIYSAWNLYIHILLSYIEHSWRFIKILLYTLTLNYSQQYFFGYVYIYRYIYIYIYIYRYPDEPLRRNYSRLVPDSLSNYRYYFALLSIEHFFHCSLATLTVFFFFWPTNCVSFDFFQLVWQGWPFLFFFPKYIFFPLTVIHCIFSSSNHLACFFTVRDII